MNPYLRTFIVLVGGFATVGGLALAFTWAFMAIIAYRPPSEVSTPAVAVPEVKRAPTARVAVKQPVKVYAGDTKARLRLPADVLANPAEHVTAATRVQASERPQTVTTTINTETGESRSFAKTDPYPWFAVETRGEVRLAVGYKHEPNGQLQQVTRLAVGYDVVRIRALTAGVVGSIDSDGSQFIGVGVAYRF